MIVAIFWETGKRTWTHNLYSMGRAFEFRKERKFKRWAGMAKTFSRITKDVIMAVKEGGDNPDSNYRLRLLYQNAKAGKHA